MADDTVSTPPGSERRPPTVEEPIGGVSNSDIGFGRDSARYVVSLSKFVRPRIFIPGKASFTWPLGTEGMRLFGNAALGIHRYIDDNAVVVDVMHRDESRIEMTGQFPGSTGVHNMLALRDVLVQAVPDEGFRLNLPRIFPNTQYVKMENYEFALDEQNARTGTINYTLTLVRTGVGPKIATGGTVPPPVNPTHQKPRGKPSRTFKVTTKYRTLHAIAKKVYGNAAKWRHLYDLNFMVLQPYGLITGMIGLSTHPLPLGIKLRY